MASRAPARDDLPQMLSYLRELGDVVTAAVDDPDARERCWCGVRTEDGLHVTATGTSLLQAARRCLNRARERGMT